MTKAIPLLVVASAVCAIHTYAATLTWDASGANPNAPVDGSGIWSTSNANWATSGTDFVWNNANNDNAVIGNSGTSGTVTVSTNITANSLQIKASSNNYTVTGTGGSVLTLTTGSLNLGQTTTLSVAIGGTNGLTKSGAGTLVINANNTYTGTTRILQAGLQVRTASGLAPSSVVVIGTSGSTTAASLDIRTANVTVAGIAAVGSSPTNNTVTNTGLAGTGTLTVNPDGAGVAAADSTFAGVIKDGNTGTFNTALVKAGGRTLTLSGTNTYTGNTTVTAGTLIINGALANASAVSVSGSGRLGGTGSIGNISVSGTIAAGNGAIGTLSTGNLTVNATGALENEFGRSGVTPVSDAIAVTGTVSLLSGANLQLSISGSNPVNGDIFYLVNNDLNDAVAGVFTKLNGVNTTLGEGSLFSFNSQSFQITYTATFGTSFTGGNDIAIQVVPEPATCALVGLGAVVLLWRGRRHFA